MYVEIQEPGKPPTPSKIYHTSSKSLNEAVAKTYKFYAAKLLQKPKDDE